MNIWNPIRLLRHSLQPDSLCRQKSPFLLLLSLFASALLFIYALIHFVQDQYTLALIGLLLLLLIVANLFWLNHINDLSISSSIFLTLLLGHNSLALMHDHFAHLGLYSAVLFPILAYLLKGQNDGLGWSTFMGGFLILYYFATRNELLSSSYTPDLLLSVLINYVVITLFIALYYRFNIQQTLSDSQHEHLRFLATHDNLTGLLNRSAFLQYMEDTLDRGRDAEVRFALLFLDLDGFKQINDHYGHGVGDQVLRMVGHRLKRCVRSSDMVCRYGGDEFLLLLHNISPAQATSVIRKIERQFSAAFAIDGENIPLHVSVGVSFCPHQHQSVTELIDQADKEMYTQKKTAKVVQS